MRFFWILLLIILTLVSIFKFREGYFVNSEIKKTLKIGNTALNLEVADDEKERVKGLSLRNELPPNTGLLFVFEKEGFYGIWMKNMNFSIDIAWLDKDKKIIHIEHNVSPLTYPKVFYPTSPALYVLETTSGFFENTHVVIGDIAS